MHAKRLYLLILLMLVPAGVALAGDALASGGFPTVATDFLSLTLYGVLGFGAWLLRGIAEVFQKGISVNVTLKVSKEDRDLLKKLTSAARIDTMESSRTEKED